MWQFGLPALLCLLSLTAGFFLGPDESIAAHLENVLLNKDLEAAQAQMGQMETALIDANLAVDMHQNAARALRDDLTALRREITALNEEVTFYKSLMAPNSLSSGLQIAELVVEQEQPSVYRYDLLLTQVALRRAYIAGDVRLDLVGHRRAEGGQDQEVVLSLTELSATEAYPLKFRFRYFQDLSGQITIPEDFMPARVLITATQKGKDPLQNSFPWQSADLQVAGGALE